MTLGDAPEPTGEKGNVHPFIAHDAQTTLLPGLADVRPADHVILLLAMLASPVESGLDFGDLLMERFMEAVETHKEQKRLEREELMRIVRAALDSHLPCQGSQRDWSLVTEVRRSATESRESLMGVPR